MEHTPLKGDAAGPIGPTAECLKLWNDDPSWENNARVFFELLRDWSTFGQEALSTIRRANGAK